MNKRIKELAEQAGLQQRIWNSLGKELPMWQEDPDNPGLAKFAELIIKECISACATDRLGKTVGVEELIKQHFGVEQ